MPLTYDYDIIEFVKKYDIPTRLIPTVNKYKELMVKEFPTPEEEIEKNLLSQVLEPYNITAEDYNKLFEAVKNVQTFVKKDLQEYLDELFGEYNKIQQNMEREFFQRTNDFDGWFVEAQTSIFDSKYFDFDNPVYRAGYKSTLVIEKSPVLKYTETLTNVYTGEVYAYKTTEKTNEGWQSQVVCEERNIDVTSIIKKIDNVWTQEVVNNV